MLCSICSSLLVTISLIVKALQNHPFSVYWVPAQDPIPNSKDGGYSPGLTTENNAFTTPSGSFQDGHFAQPQPKRCNEMSDCEFWKRETCLPLQLKPLRMGKREPLTPSCWHMKIKAEAKLAEVRAKIFQLLMICLTPEASPMPELFNLGEPINLGVLCVFFSVCFAFLEGLRWVFSLLQPLACLQTLNV